jgi:hypothetical protein
MAAQSLLEQGFEAQAKVLTDFGYHDITAETVEAAHKRWKANDPSAGVIDMFCRDAFEERPDIFGEQDPS